MRHRIYPHAQRAIKEIWKYTDRRWGEDQANAYVRGLYQVFENVANNPTIWHPVKHADLPGIYFIRYEHHYLFFREFSDGRLGVISVLHENMDIPGRLRDDQDASDSS